MPQVAIAAFGSGLVFLGQLKRKNLASWTGVGLLVGFAALFFFSLGALYVAPALLLLVLVLLANRKRPPLDGHVQGSRS